LFCGDTFQSETSSLTSNTDKASEWLEFRQVRLASGRSLRLIALWGILEERSMLSLHYSLRKRHCSDDRPMVRNG
jgi:hypothetical protein